MYSTDHDFIFSEFLDKKNIFYPHFYESDSNPNKLFVNIKAC